MAHLSQKLAEMHRRLAETAQEEQALVRALNAALNHVDEKLLSEIRQVTMQHEQRRSVIMNELQLLATRLCTFPASPNEPVALESQHMAPLSHHASDHAVPNPAANATHAPGNWRIAAQNIQDDLDFYSDPPPSSH